MKHVRFLWILPFISFACGYQLLSWLYRIDSVEVPHLVGMPLQDALVILAKQQLNPALVAEKEDTELPSGIIVSQSPHENTKIKPYQSVFIVVSKRPCPNKTPLVLNKDLDTISKELKEAGIRHKAYYLASNYPKNQCIGQFPSQGELLTDQKLITYIAADHAQPVLMPDLRHKAVRDVVAFLEKASIKPEIVHHALQDAHHTCDACIVINQRPLPGSIIMLHDNKPLPVQLIVQ